MKGTVQVNEGSSAPFSISNGVKQGCVFAPVLFNLFFSCVLHHALEGLDRGVLIRYHLDGSLFDLCRLSTKTKTTEYLITEALFADDCSLLAHSKSDLQIIMSRFTEATQLFGLTISLSKTEVLLQPAQGSTAPPPTIYIGNTHT